jgi:phospholipid transport system substrate-binding protein
MKEILGDMMKKMLFIAVVLLIFPVGCLWADTPGPMADLKPVLEDLTSVLGDDSLKGNEHREERRDKIMSYIKRGFDFREMSRRVLGSTWHEIDEKEQENFTRLMTKLLENVYIGKLENYTGQTIEYAAESVKKDRAQVTTFLENNGVKIPIHYIMRKTEPQWMVYDINIEGVSLVRNYQEQFKSILRKDKYEGLVKVLEEKNKSFLTEAQ